MGLVSTMCSWRPHWTAQVTFGTAANRIKGKKMLRSLEILKSRDPDSSISATNPSCTKQHKTGNSHKSLGKEVLLIVCGRVHESITIYHSGADCTGGLKGERPSLSKCGSCSWQTLGSHRRYYMAAIQIQRRLKSATTGATHPEGATFMMSI